MSITDFHLLDRYWVMLVSSAGFMVRRPTRPYLRGLPLYIYVDIIVLNKRIFIYLISRTLKY